MFENPLEVILLIIWTPPFMGMFLFLVLGGWLGLVMRLKPWMDKLMMALVPVGIVLLFMVPTLGLYIIPLGLGLGGFFVGRYYRLKAEIQSSEQPNRKRQK